MNLACFPRYPSLLHRLSPAVNFSLSGVTSFRAALTRMICARLGYCIYYVENRLDEETMRVRTLLRGDFPGHARFSYASSKR